MDKDISKEIENYIDILNSVVLGDNLGPISFYMLNGCDDGNYDSIRFSLDEALGENIANITKIESFCVAVFVMRNNFRIAMNNRKNTNIELYTTLFKVFNFLFFRLGVMATFTSTNVISVKSQEEIIQELVLLAWTHLNNKLYLEQKKFDAEKVASFYDRIASVSNMVGDMHSYEINQTDLALFLDNQDITKESLHKKGLAQLEKSGYIHVKSIMTNCAWIKAQKCNLSDPDDDTLILSISSFLKLDENFQRFIHNFESSKSRKTSDSENELIFSFKTSKYIFISKFCMERTQLVIESFSTWGQYESLHKYYYKIKRDEQVLKKYNRLMTYKIADLLMSNQYVLPMESKKIAGKKIEIPRVEIKDFDSKEKKLGDIDVLFFSPHTNTLYVLEYKNYQMFISDTNLDSEISKIKRENTIDKMTKRKNDVIYSGTTVLKQLFGESFTQQQYKTEAIIITTKPNFYFFVNSYSQYIYMDWIEFQEKIVSNQL